jgi:phosphogluconate dehydratase
MRLDMNKVILDVTQRIVERSKETRQEYLDAMQEQFRTVPSRSGLQCGNLAHAFAGCGHDEKAILAEDVLPNIGIITAYNDMLSAHKPYEHYPEKIREYARNHNAVAQVAGGVPAMCDGVTQGQVGMELSLFSRDVIAMSSVIGLSHRMFDAILNLGICDKIVPGLMMGSLRFGYLPTVFVPAGPMPTGISNDEKSQIRQAYAEGKIGRAELLKGESDSYHSPGTCTFYGTANSNQMLMEIMGLQLPGSSFVNPGTELRDLLTEEAVKAALALSNKKEFSATMAGMVTEKTIVNAIIGLLATGGSTNHTIHIIAIARAAGIIINWDDFSDLSSVIPLLARVYPNGAADVNHFHAAGGVGFVMRSLLEHGLLHDDVNTILGHGLVNFTKEPFIENGKLSWREGAKESLNTGIVRPVSDPFKSEGGIKVLKGNIGRSVIKTSAVDSEHLIVEAPAVVFDEQEDFIAAFKRGELNKDLIAVLAFQGPKQNGMPELHQLTPSLTILQKRGYKVALLTDGRMSGASGKVPAAIHMVPEASDGGFIGKIQTGDLLRLDAVTGTLECLTEGVDARPVRTKKAASYGLGRELFTQARRTVSDSEQGASFII